MKRAKEAQEESKRGEAERIEKRHNKKRVQRKRKPGQDRVLTRAEGIPPCKSNMDAHSASSDFSGRAAISKISHLFDAFDSLCELSRS